MESDQKKGQKNQNVSAAFQQYTKDVSRNTWLRAGTVSDLIYEHSVCACDNERRVD